MLELELLELEPELELPLLGRFTLLELLFVPVLPELDEFPLLERLTLPELLLEVFPLERLEVPLLGRFRLLLFVPVLPELDELPLLGRLTLPELLLEVFPLGRLEVPLLGRFTLLEPLLEAFPFGRVVAPFWLLLVPELFGRTITPVPFGLLVVPLFGRTVAPLSEPFPAFALLSSRELMLPGILFGLIGRTVACELPFGCGAYPWP